MPFGGLLVELKFLAIDPFILEELLYIPQHGRGIVLD
jgi:hypothetical protein